MTWRFVVFGLLVVVIEIAPAVTYSPVHDLASVVDGDTIEIHSERIRLHGIDATAGEERRELDGRQHRCGQVAALALSDKVG